MTTDKVDLHAIDEGCRSNSLVGKAAAVLQTNRQTDANSRYPDLRVVIEFVWFFFFKISVQNTDSTSLVSWKAAPSIWTTLIYNSLNVTILFYKNHDHKYHFCSVYHIMYVIKHFVYFHHGGYKKFWFIWTTLIFNSLNLTILFYINHGHKYHFCSVYHIMYVVKHFIYLSLDIGASISYPQMIKSFCHWKLIYRITGRIPIVLWSHFYSSIHDPGGSSSIFVHGCAT